jgi:hypothetical protein
MLLAHELWAASTPDRTAGIEIYTVAETEALEKAAIDLRAIWRSLPKSEQGIVAALARGESPLSRHRSDGGTRGTTAKRAIDKLVDAGEVIEEEDGFRLVDPFFAELVRRSWDPAKTAD